MKEYKSLFTFCGIVLSEIIAFAITNIFSLDFSMQVPIGNLILIFLLVMTGFTYFFIHLNKKLQETKKDNNKLKSELAENSIDYNSGNMLLMMAFTQSQYKELKISMLEEAYKKHNNLIAGLYLADIYSNGIEYNGKVFIKKNREKSARIYECMCDYDKYGVCEWMLGWYYQNRLIDKAKIKSNYIDIAEKYYIKSKDKGFPKAFNSIGNFMIKKLNGHVESEEINAIAMYIEASNKNDIFGTLNCGNHYFYKYKLNCNIEDIDSAIKYYKIAAQKKSEEGYLKLGICYEEKYSKTYHSSKDDSLLVKARNCYVKAITSIVFDNQFSASAYYKLGRLIAQYPNLANDTITKKAIKPYRFGNAYIECFVKSYEMFQAVMAMEDGSKATGTFKQYYDNIIRDFNNFAK